jgi:lipopolysaccharide export system permease protein
MIRIIDKYIIGKFLSTFFLAIVLIMMIVVVFDISERMEDFLLKKPPLKEVVFDFYLNLIPFYANTFSPLFTFIAVIYFTSRMAYRSEIIAILGSGISFRRMLLPYMISAAVLALLSLYLNHYVIPRANGVRLAFEEKYIRNAYENKDKNIHRQIAPETYIYINGYDHRSQTGNQFSLEKIKNGERYYYLRSETLAWDSTKKEWSLGKYFIRKIDGMHEVMSQGEKLDTALDFQSSEFGARETKVEAMQTPELNSYIDAETLKGSSMVPFYEVEKHGRTAYPFATFVLTLIGVSVASRRVRGGIGWHIGIGLLISFSYILFMRFSSTFATNGSLSPWIAVWIPNVIFIVLALFMLRAAPK